jgi:hypothetical protein
MGGTIETFKPRFAGDTEENQLRERVVSLEANLNEVLENWNTSIDKRNSLLDQFSDYKEELWCALGQPLNVEYIQAVKELVAERNQLRATRIEANTITNLTDDSWHQLSGDGKAALLTRENIEGVLSRQVYRANLADGQALYKQASTFPETQKQIEQRKKGIEWLGGLLSGMHSTPEYAMEILMREQKALAELVPVKWKQ